jgi:alkylhydroperoxidase family enzyme
MLAHGALLRKNFFTAEQLAAIVSDFHHADLSQEEVAIMSFAQKITTQPSAIGEEDYQALRSFNLADEEILDVVLACTARNFFSKTLDALGVEPDSAYQDLEPELIQVLSIGRPFPG